MNQEENMEGIIEDHNKIDIYISLCFTILDVIIYFSFLCLFSCFNRELSSIKQNISFLILLDISSRIINMFYNTLAYSFIKEILFTIFAAGQFYFIITIFNQIFQENSYGKFANKVEIKYPF